MKKRVVVTGLGAVTPIGIGVDKMWESVKNGVCGIDKVTKFDTSEFTSKVGAEIKDFEPTDYIDKKEARRMDRYTHFAMAAAKMAVQDSGIDVQNEDCERIGVIVGSGIGGLETLEDQCRTLFEKGPGRVSPFFIPMMITNIASGRIAIEYGFKGFNECVITACATGNNAIGDSFKVIQRGDADIMVAGGSEASITAVSYAGFCSMKALTTTEDPKKACRPFDAQRNGFVMGEGSGILILEEYEHAVARGAKIYAEVLGYGCTCDAYHITAPAPNGEGGARCMKNALKDAGITPEEVDYINAHGTSTEYNDAYETMAIKTVFGEYAKKLAVSSTKSMTGHLLGAAGAVEAIISIMAINDNFLPPTIGFENPDEECDLDYVVNKGRTSEVNCVLSNSLGFGGHNAALIFRKV